MLLGGILVVLALYAALVGILAVRRLAIGMWGLALFAFIGLAAALTRPDSTAEYIVPDPGRRGGRGVRADQAGPRGGTAERAPVPDPAARGAGRSGSRAPGGPGVPPAPETLTPPDLPAPPAVASNPGAADPRPESGASPSGYSFTYLPNPDDPGPRAGPRGGGSWSAAG